MRDGAAVYGVLIGVIGVGSIVGSFGLDWLKARGSAPTGWPPGATGERSAPLLFGAARGPVLALPASLHRRRLLDRDDDEPLHVGAGGASRLGAGARHRGLSDDLFRLGDGRRRALGQGRDLVGVPSALFISAGCRSLGLLATRRWKLQTGAALDLTPSLHWREPAIAAAREEQGPVLALVEYVIDPKDREPFLALMKEIGRERKRDGAYAWNVFEDPLKPGRVSRDLPVSVGARTEIPARPRDQGGSVDRGEGARLSAAPPNVNFLVAPRRERFARRKRAPGPPQRFAERRHKCERRLRFACLRNPLKSLERPDRGKNVVEIGARRRPDAASQPPIDRLAPQMQENGAVYLRLDSRRQAGRKSFQNCSGSTG